MSVAGNGQLGKMDGVCTADHLDEAKLRTSIVLGLQTRHYESGEGEVLLFLHGGHIGFVDSLDSWSLIFPHMERRFRVLALDKLGQGHTAPPEDPQAYTQTHTLAHAVAWLDQQHLRRVHVIGHSRGGLLAAQLAQVRPDLISSVVVVDSATLAPEPADPAASATEFYRRVGAYSYSPEWDEESIVNELSQNSFSHEHISEGHITRRLAFARRERFAAAAQRMQSGLLDRVFLPDLDRARAQTLAHIDEQGLKVRTLQVWGADDPSAPLTEVGIPLLRRLSAKTAAVSMHVFARAGHYPFREHPREFSELIATHVSLVP